MISAIAVYANNIKGNTSKESERNMIDYAMNEKKVINHFVHGDDEVSTYNIESDVSYNVEKAVKVYNIFDVNDILSIIDSLNEDYDNILVPIEQNNQCIGIATLKNGEQVEKVRKEIKEKQIETNEQEKILQRFAEKEGRLYVHSVLKLGTDYEYADMYFNHEELTERVKQTVNEDISDEAYVYIERDNTYTYVFRAGEKEYLIPYSLSRTSALENGHVYRSSEAIELLKQKY